MTPASPGFYLALGLAGMAGFVDALGFLSLGGIFVSFMSGNTTQLGTRIARGDLTSAMVVVPAAVLALFLAGVIAGTALRRKIGARGAGVVAAVVAALLLGAAAAATLAWRPLAIGLTVLAMGATNTVLVGGGGTGMGVTYVTGAIVKLGQAIGGRLVGDRDDTWRFQLSLWACLAAGAVAGAMAYGKWQLMSLWLAFAAAALLVGPVLRSEGR